MTGERHPHVEREKDTRKKRRWPWVFVGLIDAYMIWCFLGPVRWTTTERTKHAGEIEIRTTSLHVLAPYAGIAENDTLVISPIPCYHVTKEYALALFVKNQQRFATQQGDFVYVYPSPSGAYVVIQPWLYTRPLQIYVTATDEWAALTVPDQEFPNHYNQYPFHFLHWDGDDGFLVDVTGPAYRQLWRVDAKTTKRTRIE